MTRDQENRFHGLPPEWRKIFAEAESGEKTTEQYEQPQLDQYDQRARMTWTDDGGREPTDV